MSQGEEDFDFKEELREFLESKFIQDAKFGYINEGQNAQVTIITLEGTAIQVDWSIQKGIQITEMTDKDGQNLQIGKDKFDDFFILLSHYSPKYQDAFSNSLNNKLLQALAEQQQQEQQE